MILWKDVAFMVGAGVVAMSVWVAFVGALLAYAGGVL